MSDIRNVTFMMVEINELLCRYVNDQKWQELGLRKNIDFYQKVELAAPS